MSFEDSVTVWACPRCGWKMRYSEEHMVVMRMRCNCIPGGFKMVLTEAARFVDCGEFRLRIADSDLKTVDRGW